MGNVEIIRFSKDMKNRSIAGVIAELKKSETRPKVGDGKALEDHVRNVFQTLLDLELENTVVGRGVSLRGSRGSVYEIDVYYEFEIAGMRHRVAIECKNSSRPVGRDDVLAFALKVQDCQGVIGVIVSANGYQSGARESAEQNGLKVLSMEELPSIGQLLALRLDNVVMPGAEAKGQPFWTLYDPGTNEPYSFAQGRELFGVLFFSRAHVEKYAKTCRLSPRWVVRGMEMRHLATYVLTCDFMRGRVLIVQPSNENAFELNGFEFQEIRRDDLIAEFYSGKPLSKIPMVAPSRRK
ncbi:restriction endonuclease [Paraburkholderia tropica]|uniref:restriction endonuclease n=1 Tax=Paraburkholderia tropica TaxID=92647 RepID=UPI002AB6E15C|nr:restriction endonuclease [Paraburkholderia tropica]